jgi:hypothetical protein
MKHTLFALVALTVLPTFALASDRYRTYDRPRDYYHGGGYSHYDRGHSHSSFGLSFNWGGGYYGRPYYRETYYRPVYRDYCPPVYYYPAPVYYPRAYYAPVRYYDRDCGYYDRGYYDRPSFGFSFNFGRSYYR